jgi:hypothetical protein
VDDQTARVYDTKMVRATQDQLDHERKVHDDYKAKAKAKDKRAKSSSDKGGTATQGGGKGGKKSRGGGRGGKPSRQGKGTFHPTSYQLEPYPFPNPPPNTYMDYSNPPPYTLHPSHLDPQHPSHLDPSQSRSEKQLARAAE